VAGSSPYINERSQGFNGRAQPKDLEIALQLTYAYFTAPRKDMEMFNTLINKNKDALIIKANDPGPVFQDTLQAVLGNYNTRRTSATLAKLEQVKLDRAFEIYKERFADASAFTFVFIGSFNTDSIKPLLEKYLGSLPATHKNEKAVDLNIHPAEGRIEKTVYKGTEQKAGVSLIFHGPYQFSQENNINMNALKETLQIRMIERLRESESGAYSPSVGFSAGRNPERFMISVNFGCSPQNVDKLIASVLDEVEKLKASGPPEVNLDKFKAEDTRSLELNLRSNSFWMNYIIDRLMGAEDLHAIFNYNKALEKVTTKTVQAKAKEYLTGKNYIRMVLMPEKESKTK
jgi:zinc protease